MRRRRRFLAGTLALVAMTFSFTEMVLASVCAPMPGMTVAADVTDRDADASASMDCLFATGHGDPEGGGDDGRHCPFGPTMGPGCSGVASLPALSSPMRAPPSEVASRILFDEARHDLLLAHAAFHPPRA